MPIKNQLSIGVKYGIFLLLCLTGCSVYRVNAVEKKLIGMPIEEAEIYLGQPNVEQQKEIPTYPDGRKFFEYVYAEASSNSTVPVPLMIETLFMPITIPISMLSGSINIGVGSAKNCHIVITTIGGIIKTVTFSGENGGIMGEKAVCEPLIRSFHEQGVTW